MGHFGQGFPMRIRIFGSMMALLAGMGTALAQGPSAPASGGSPPAAVKIPSATPDGAPNFMPGADGTVLPSNDPALLDGNTAVSPTASSGYVPVGGNGMYGSAEYILWKLKDAPTPVTFVQVPVATSGINTFTSSVSLGGSGGIDYGGRSGGRLTLGYWFDPEVCGGEVSGFWVERRAMSILNTQQVSQTLNVTVIQNITTQVVSGGAVTLTTTQTPINIQLPSTLTVASIGTAVPSSFWGTEVNARSTRCHFGGLSIDLLGGFRYINLSEGLLIGSLTQLQTAQPNTPFTTGPLTPNANGIGFANLPAIPAPITGLTTILSVASLNNLMTHNNFYGANFGTSWDWAVTDRLHFEGYGKIGVGAMTETFTITGGSAVATAAVSGFSAGGILPAAAFYNYGKTRYAVTPELNFRLGYNICRNLKATIGYNFLYLSSVVRPGEQIAFNPFNVSGSASTSSTSTSSSGTTTTSGGVTTTSGAGTNINIAGSNISVPSNQQPFIAPKDSDFWAQGLTLGFEISY